MSWQCLFVGKIFCNCKEDLICLVVLYMGPKEPTLSVIVAQIVFITYKTKLKEYAHILWSGEKKLVDIPVNNYSDIVIHIDQYLLKNTFKLLVSEKNDLTDLHTLPLQIIHQCDLCEFSSELRHFRDLSCLCINLFISMVII